jgi:hypothetical protein
MKRVKRIFALSMVFILIFSTTLEMQPLVEANPANPYPAIAILDPNSWKGCCYSNASISLKIGVLLAKTNVPAVYYPQVDNISYSLDSKENVTLSNFKPEGWAKTYPGEPIVSLTVSSTLYNLTEGNHTLRAYSSDGKLVTNELTFTVDSNYRGPKLTLISPKNTTYKNQVELIFSINKDYKNARYLLDYESSNYHGPIPIKGNTTLTNLAEGTHKIMVFADCIDRYTPDGIATGQGIGFTIDKDAQTSSPSPNAPEFPSFAIVFLFTITLSLTLALRKKYQVISR